MKTINSIKLLLSVFAVVSFMLVLKSCKKADIAPPDNIKTAEATRAAALQAIKAQYGNVSAGIVFNVNKTADELFYKNTAGKMVSLYAGSNNVVAAPCLYNCNNTTNPANLRIVTTLDYVQRFYICESGSSPAKSKVSVKWTVSAPFTITNVTPDGALNTFGKVKFTPSGGPAVILTATANDPGFVYTNLGTDPACSMNTLYSVTYYFEDVDDANFASGTQLDALLSLSNDCALIGNLLSTGYVSGPTFNQNAYLPCNRIDKVYVVPAPPPPGAQYATATGNYALCSPPSGFALIDLHQLEYRKVVSTTGSLKWDDQFDIFGTPSPVYWGQTIPPSPVLSPTMPPSSVLNLLNMLNGSGTWLVRYRNVKTGSCNVVSPSTPNGNWGNPALWVTEVWSL